MTTIDDVPSCGQENDHRRAAQPKVSTEISELADRAWKLATAPTIAPSSVYANTLRECTEMLRRYSERTDAGPRQNFERIIASLNYDGADTDSLTVGEIRRALP